MGFPKRSASGSAAVTFAHDLAVSHTDGAIGNLGRIVVQQRLCGWQLRCSQEGVPQSLCCQASKERLCIEGCLGLMCGRKVQLHRCWCLRAFGGDKIVLQQLSFASILTESSSGRGKRLAKGGRPTLRRAVCAACRTTSVFACTSICGSDDVHCIGRGQVLVNLKACTALGGFITVKESFEQADRCRQEPLCRIEPREGMRTQLALPLVPQRSAICFCFLVGTSACPCPKGEESAHVFTVQHEQAYIGVVESEII